MSLRVLIVEDEMLVAMLAEDMLCGLGHFVVAVAGSLARGLVLAETSALDLALLDVNLSGQTSDEIADVLDRRGVPFFFVTGYGVDGVAPRHRGRPVLAKPYDEASLRAAIETTTGAGRP